MLVITMLTVCLSVTSGQDNILVPKTVPTSTFTVEDFQKAINALGKPEAAPKAQAFVHSLTEADISSKREAAMFLAQTWHESSGLDHKEEVACTSSDAAKNNCDAMYPLTPGKGINGKHYYGRGYIQLTMDTNYENASKALYGDASKLLNDPDSVAATEEVAWKTATWYWKTVVHKSPGVQEVKFGATTKAINGVLECTNPQGEALIRAKKRFEYYTIIMKAIGDSGILDETGCYN